MTRRAGVFCMIASVVVPAALSLAMVTVNAGGRLGVDPNWVWVLTACQVTTLAAIGRGVREAWLFAASVQACWITYGVATGQLGFLPGCCISIAIQIFSYRRSTPRPSSQQAPAPVPTATPSEVRRGTT